MIDKDTYRRVYSTGYQHGHRAGAEQMRERAAQTAMSGEHYGFIEQDIADAIRALPISETGEGDESDN